MKKFLEYVYMRDWNDNYIFPSPIGHIVVVILIILCCVIGCHKNEDEVKHIDMTIAVDTTSYPAEKVEVNVNEDFIIPKTTYWSSQETKLPIGVVHAMDFSHGTKGDKTRPDNISDNYVTIKGKDGKLTITKDIDDDLYLNMEVGDTIR